MSTPMRRTAAGLPAGDGAPFIKKRDDGSHGHRQRRARRQINAHRDGERRQTHEATFPEQCIEDQQPRADDRTDTDQAPVELRCSTRRVPTPRSTSPVARVTESP